MGDGENWLCRCRMVNTSLAQSCAGCGSSRPSAAEVLLLLDEAYDDLCAHDDTTALTSGREWCGGCHNYLRPEDKTLRPRILKVLQKEGMRGGDDD